MSRLRQRYSLPCRASHPSLQPRSRPRSRRSYRPTRLHLRQSCQRCRHRHRSSCRRPCRRPSAPLRQSPCNRQPRSSGKWPRGRTPSDLARRPQ
ncbi:hypothetical protein E9677_24070 [Rhizobium rhizophilum]|uniref:Uncharacterized protein n=1 Tax=Rhizobium rhizophilum TaxID=1850373 RepID=A0ABY2QMW8_9HYPH|nr:hypothetical protein E9677_24070 [Rhizobium rhizophilum]